MTSPRFRVIEGGRQEVMLPNGSVVDVSHDPFVETRPTAQPFLRRLNALIERPDVDRATLRYVVEEALRAAAIPLGNYDHKRTGEIIDLARRANDKLKTRRK